MRAPMPPDESARLRALDQYDVIGLEENASYSDLVALAATICTVPFAAISIIAEDRQHLKAAVGIGFSETCRDDAFCAHTILDPTRTLVVTDTLLDPRFVDNVFVRSEPNIRFYAGAPVVSQEGYALGTVCVFSSEPRSLTNEQVSALEAIARQVRDQFEMRRALKLLRAQAIELNVARELAESGRRAKSTFLANLGHEIRTPMSGVLGVADLFEATELNEKQRRFLETIRRSGESLMRVLEDLMDFAETEAGLVEVRPSIMEPNEVLQDIVSLHRPAAITKRISLNASNGVPNDLRVFADPARIRQVLNILVSNSVKFTEEGWIEVANQAVNLAEESVRIRFTVRDTGIGMDENQVQAARLGSAQGADSVQTTRHGVGIGLSTARHLLERMESQLEVSSDVGKGTTFAFELDCRLAREDSSKKRRVLVADDNDVIVLLIASMLESYGLDVTCVGDGVAAVQALTSGSFDMAFIDVEMPEMDGVTVAQRIRAEEQGKRIPIIAITSDRLVSEEVRCLRAGMDELICKPISERALSEAVERWIPKGA